jgi:hypothetical protein
MLDPFGCLVGSRPDGIGALVRADRRALMVLPAGVPAVPLLRERLAQPGARLALGSDGLGNQSFDVGH